MPDVGRRQGRGIMAEGQPARYSLGSDSRIECVEFGFTGSLLAAHLYRVISRSARTGSGAIHASGSLPIRSRSARSAQSRSSFLTRR